MLRFYSTEIVFIIRTSRQEQKKQQKNLKRTELWLCSTILLFLFTLLSAFSSTSNIYLLPISARTWGDYDTFTLYSSLIKIETQSNFWFFVSLHYETLFQFQLFKKHTKSYTVIHRVFCSRKLLRFKLSSKFYQSVCSFNCLLSCSTTTDAVLYNRHRDKLYCINLCTYAVHTLLCIHLQCTVVC